MKTLREYTHTHTHTDNLKNKKGITLVALVVTIIILLILAGITISQLTGSELFENAKLAKEKSDEAQEKEDETLSEYENSIDKYISNNRETVTIDKEEYESILTRLTALEDGAEYKPGDIFYCTSTMDFSGFITNSKKLIRITIPLGKTISQDIKNVKISSTAFNVRAEGKYILPSSAAVSTGYSIADYFDVTAYEENYIRISHTADTAFSCTNNIPLAIEIQGLKIEFE